jgi:uncharacterized protein
MVFIWYLLIGASAGLLSGLIGIGGGIVLVPALLLVFHYLHFNSTNLMQVVVATSFAAIMVTTLYAYYKHRSYDLPYKEILIKLLPGVVLGSITGSIVSHYIYSVYLKEIFGGLMLLNALLMLITKPVSSKKVLPSRKIMWAVGYMIGGICGMLGIGGSVFIIPYLNYYNVNMHVSVVVSVAVGLIISFVSLLVYIITGLHVHGLPHDSIGYVYWPAWLLIIVGSLAAVPLGVRMSHRISTKKLRAVFAMFLLLVGVQMMFFAK